MSISIPSATAAAITAAALSMFGGAQPASIAPAPEPAEEAVFVRSCPRIDDLARTLRANGFSSQAAVNYAVLTQRDCLDDSARQFGPARGLADAAGYTLYRYERKPLPVAKRQSHPRVDHPDDRRLLDCDPGSPAGWLPVTSLADLRSSGVDSRRVGSLQRANGARHITINGCPVYRPDGDRQPGQVSGDGTAGRWFAVQPTA